MQDVDFRRMTTPNRGRRIVVLARERIKPQGFPSLESAIVAGPDGAWWIVSRGEGEEPAVNSVAVKQGGRCLIVKLPQVADDPQDRGPGELEDPRNRPESALLCRRLVAAERSPYMSMRGRTCALVSGRDVAECEKTLPDGAWWVVAVAGDEEVAGYVVVKASGQFLFQEAPQVSPDTFLI